MPNIPVKLILPNPDQPRKDFDKEKLEALAASIKQQGIIQAITVEQNGDQYILEDGERRLRAAKMVGLQEIPATINPARTGPDVGARLERALVANLHRQDMNPIEEAQAYYRLKTEHHMSVLKIARHLGVTGARITARLEWIDIEPEIQELVAQGKLQKSPEVAIALKAITDKKVRIQAARRLTRKGITIRMIVRACDRIREELMQELPAKDHKSQAAAPAIFFGKQRSKHSWKSPIYEELVERHKYPSWPLLALAAEKACKACALYDIASPKMCIECPAVDLISNVVDISAKPPKEKNERSQNQHTN